MPEDTDDSAVGEKTIRRVRNLAIFFIGIGVFAAAGFGLEYSEQFIENSTTYFSVGSAIGVIGILLGLISKW